MRDVAHDVCQREVTDLLMLDGDQAQVDGQHLMGSVKLRQQLPPMQVLWCKVPVAMPLQEMRELLWRRTMLPPHAPFCLANTKF